MPAKRRRAKASAAPAAAEPSTSSQAASMSTTSQTGESSSQGSGKRAKADNDHGDGVLPTAEPSPYMLPIELLVDIFLYLNTLQVGRAARVCKTWHAASTDVRLWRIHSFKQTSSIDDLPNDGQRKLRKQFKSMGARSGNTVESIELEDLPWKRLFWLAESLSASAPSLRHIRWSSMRRPDSTDEVVLEEVAKLAMACPRLETLQLHTMGRCKLWWLLDDDACIAKPRHISLTAKELMEPFTPESPPQPRGGPTVLFDHAATIEVMCTEDRKDKLNGCVSLRVFARLLENQAIEKLTVHGLWVGPSSQMVRSLSAPALTHLDLRYSGLIDYRFAQLDVPQLRELAIDGRLLSKLTPASTAMLSSLTLRLVRLEGSHHYPLQTLGLGSVMDHQGSVKLSVNFAYMHEVLDLFFHDFFWPGLEHFLIELHGQNVCDLIKIIAARQAGARGATKEQYFAILRDESLASSSSPQATLRAAQRLMSLAETIEVEAHSQPLCSSVQWSIVVDQCVPAIVADWLRELPNVVLT